MLALGTGLAAAAGRLDELLPLLGMLAGVAAAASAPWPRRLEVPVLALEAAAAPLLLFSWPGPPDAYFPYLVVAPVGAAWFGLRSTLAVSVSYSIGAVLGIVVSQPNREQFLYLMLWSMQALALGLLVAVIRRVTASPASVDAQLVAARSLLTELDKLSRSLPGSLDVVGESERLLEGALGLIPMRGALVVTGSDAKSMQPLAVHPPSAATWTQSQRFTTVLEQALATRGPVSRQGGFDDSEGARHAVPLISDSYPIGVLAFESEGRLPPESMTDMSRGLRPLIIRLEVALLFDELRAKATMEERSRIAREMHDGIAQDLASLGYALDALTRSASDPSTREQTVAVRDEVSRLVSELRMSIYDLRSSTDPGGSLTAVLSDYVRRVGTRSGFTVHLSMAETPHRLPVAVEVEVFRIAQEAVANARKHSGASTLWVSCEVAPPAVWLRVDDDGHGVGTRASSGVGLQIMQERAERIGAELAVSARPGGGMTVEMSRKTDGVRRANQPISSASNEARS